jgi:hypothetical protein
MMFLKILAVRSILVVIPVVSVVVGFILEVPAVLRLMTVTILCDANTNGKGSAQHNQFGKATQKVVHGTFGEQRKSRC